MQCPEVGLFHFLMLCHGLEFVLFGALFSRPEVPDNCFAEGPGRGRGNVGTELLFHSLTLEDVLQ